MSLTKGNSTNVSYNYAFSFKIGADGVNIKTGISSSYTTILSSPEIYNEGSIVLGEGKTVFSYMDKDKDPKNYDNDLFKNYITNQSFQTSAQIYRSNKIKDFKSKFVLFDDINQLNMFENLQTYQVIADRRFYKYDKFPLFCRSEYSFDFKTPKYILLSERNKIWEKYMKK